jgi:splicing factor 3B subunit 2
MGEPVDKNLWGELEPEGMLLDPPLSLSGDFTYVPVEEEEEESEEEEEEEEEVRETTPTDGLQTPSGMETPSGMASVVSTVAGGLETPDFLELRKTANRATSEIGDSGPRSLYQVVPEKQTAVRGLMGSERGYDVTAIAGGGTSIPVLGEERGTKVSRRILLNRVDV